MDEEAVTKAVEQVEEVTRVDIRSRPMGQGWALHGEIGLPDDRGRALTVYDNCLGAIASCRGDPPPA